MTETNRILYLVRDLGIIALSVAVAITLAKTGILGGVLTATQELKFLGSFLAGVFFISVFTAAPAMVVIVELARANSPVEVAIFGGLGALVGDLIVFRFIRDTLAEDISRLVQGVGNGKLRSVFRLGLFKWLTPFIGALIIASPLPDEVGITMLGLSKMRTSLFIPVSLGLNFLGILMIALLAKNF